MGISSTDEIFEPVKELSLKVVWKGIKESKFDSRKAMLLSHLKSMGAAIEEIEEVEYLSKPISDITEDIEAYRFTTTIRENKLFLTISDTLSLNTPILVEVFITDGQLRAVCGESHLLAEDVERKVYER